MLSALQYGVASIAMQTNEILIAVNAHENHVNWDSYDKDGGINYLLLCKKIIPKCSGWKQ